MEREADIPFELSTTIALEIITRIDSKAGKSEINVEFKDSSRATAGKIIIRLRPPTSREYGYNIKDCLPTTRFTDESRPPPDDDKVWRIWVDKSSGIRLVIYCNDKTLVDISMSDSSCSASKWSETWSKDVKMIKFHKSYDKASEQYRQSGKRN